MEPTKRESISRQSSILKPPKQRQPLQCVAANPSSSENSPTIKVKRRVSFAKNKRIREFCNEAEQGTVWDDTYEEHDVSSIKSNSSNGNDQPLIISVPAHDKENFPVQLFLPNPVECQDTQQCIPRENQDNLSQSDMEMDNSINTAGAPCTQNNEIAYPNATIYCDDMDLTAYVPSEIIPSVNKETCNDKLTHKASNSTDLTEAISALLGAGPSNKYTNRKEIKNVSYNTEITDRLNNEAMEFTSVLPSSTWIRPNDSQFHNCEITENFTSKTMEFTEAIPHANIQRYEIINKNNTLAEKTKIFSNKSMEITETIPMINLIHQSGVNAITQEKTTIFANNSMEMTEAVTVFKKANQLINQPKQSLIKEAQDKTTIFLNKSMEFTEAISIVDKCKMIQEKNQTCDNQSMEITEIVSNNERSKANNNSADLLSEEKIQDKLKIMSSVSMKITDNVSAYNKIHQPGASVEKLSKSLNLQSKNYEDLSYTSTSVLMEFASRFPEVTDTLRANKQYGNEEKTENFINKTMEFTTTVPCSNIHNNLVSDKNNCSPEKTKIFSNKSMEITEAIPVSTRINQQVVDTTLAKIQEKTKIFMNNSMEMTQVVQLEKLPSEITQDKTKVFNNSSMNVTETESVHNNIKHAATEGDITERDLIYTKNYESNLNTNKIRRKSSQKPNTFYDKSMVSSLPNENIERQGDPVQNKTQLFSSKAMDISETVPLHREITSTTNSAERSSAVLNSDNRDKTKIFFDNSMNLTESVSVYQKADKISEIPHQNRLPPNPVQEKTKIFMDKSMDVTETVPIRQHMPAYNLKSQKFTHDNTQEKTRVFMDKSMEMTETMPIYKENLPSTSNHQKLPQNTVQEKTKIFMDKSMDVTETIPIHQHIPAYNLKSQTFPHNNTPEKTRVFIDKSMEMTETMPIYKENLPSTSNHQKLPHDIEEEQTKFFFDKSMDVTETIPIRRQIPAYNLNSQKLLCNDQQEKTRIFMDKSMEMTETLSTHKANFPSASSHQKLPHDIEEEKTKFFLDKSMDVTETMPIYQRIPTSNLNNKKLLDGNMQEKTRVFLDKSMDMTETIAVSSKPDYISYPKENYASQEKNYDEYRNSIRPQVDSKFNDNNQFTNCQGVYEEGTKMFHNASMELTELPPVSYNNATASKPFKEFNHPISNRVAAVQSSMNISNQLNKDNNYEISGRYNTREETFHRITSDELNSLCASMNLPTQKYDKNESISVQNNFLPVCNDVNVLRDSLEKNGMFHLQESAVNENTLTDRNRSMSMPSKNCENDRKSSNFQIFSDADMKDQSLLRRDETNVHATMELSNIHRSLLHTAAGAQDNFNMSTTTNMLYKSVTAPLTEMEIDKTAEVTLNYSKNQQNFDLSLPSSDKMMDYLNENSAPLNVLGSANENDCRSLHVANAKDERRVLREITLDCPIKETVGMCSLPTTSAENSKDTHTISNTLTRSKSLSDNILPESEKLISNKIQSHQDPSTEFMKIPSSTIPAKDESHETNKNIFISNANGSMKIHENVNKEKSYILSTENTLNRIPSDNTDLLLATMGFKTDLPHSLIINEKSVITIPSAKKLHPVGTCADPFLETETELSNEVANQTKPNSLTNSRIQEDIENLQQNIEIPIVKNDLEINDAESDLSDKENKEPSIKENKDHSIRVNLFPEKYSEELEDIQPPSFLCSDSIQEDSNQGIETPNDDCLNSSMLHLNEESINALSSETGIRPLILNERNSNQFSADEFKNYSNINTSPSTQETNTDEPAAKKCCIDEVNESICESKNEEPPESLSPFLSLTETIKLYEKRDDCIWTIRIINSKMIAIDFISKSFVVVIRLNDIEEACIRDIEDLEIISRLRDDSKNVLLKIVHNLLISKLNPSDMLEQYKMYENILPMLEYISSEVILAMNFMFDLERLSALNLLNIDIKRISFMVSSKKTNIILKVSLAIKVFNEIGPDDIDVICVLGDIRKNDIKQLIVNIKRDHKFLSRYINDIKDYITLMEECTRI